MLRAGQPRRWWGWWSLGFLRWLDHGVVIGVIHVDAQAALNTRCLALGVCFKRFHDFAGVGLNDLDLVGVSNCFSPCLRAALITLVIVNIEPAVLGSLDFEVSEVI